MLIRKLFVIPVVCLALAACAQKPSGEAGKEAKPRGQVLAEVNGVAITTDQFQKEVENLPPYLKPMTETAEGKKELLDTIVIREIILQQAQKDGLDKSQAVADKLEEMKKRVVVEAFLKKKVEEHAAVSDEEMQKFYDQNKDKFKAGDEVRASHILVKTEKEAQDVLAQLKAGAKFEDLAKKYSIDSAGAKGGDLGWFGKGAMIPEFEKTAFSMKEGETSGIVKTKFGYHIIKVTGKRAAGTRSFAEVKDQIKAAIIPSKQQEVFQKLKEDLKKGAKITIKEDALQGLGGKPGEMGKGAPGEAKPAAPPEAKPAEPAAK